MSNRLEVLCVTMGQLDFRKIEQMNISCDVLFANQGGTTAFSEMTFHGCRARMITTETRGVGVNRNIALEYAKEEVCLLADDDMRYIDGYEDIILKEFADNPNADIIIFNIGTNTPEIGRLPTQIKKKRYMHRWSRNPFGAPRIAFRKTSVLKSNIRFSPYFGGGGVFRNGEDTIWLKQMMDAGLKVLLSPKYIGDVSYEVSTCYSDNQEERIYTTGAITEASEGFLKPLYFVYYTMIRNYDGVPKTKAIHLFLAGMRGYSRLLPFPKYVEEEHNIQK